MIDEHGWTQRDPISDEECILICLNNAPCGTDKKQVARLVEKYKPTKRKEAPTYKGISLFMLRGALGDYYMRDWTEEERATAWEKINEQN